MDKTKYLIISHESFAKGLKETIEMVIGPQEDLKALCLMAEMSPETFREMLEKEICANEEQGYMTMVLVDLLGGTPFNSLIPILKTHPDVSFVAGVNLPICVELLCGGTFESAQEMEEVAKSAGVKSIITKGEIFNRKEEE